MGGERFGREGVDSFLIDVEESTSVVDSGIQEVLPQIFVLGKKV